MATFAVFDETTLLSVQEQVKKISQIISLYQWIIDAYVSDFFTKDHWQRLPSSHIEYFDAITPPDLAWLLSPCNSQHQPCCRPIPPLSLLALRQCISSLSLQRLSVDVYGDQTKEIFLSVLSKEKSRTKSDKSIPGGQVNHIEAGSRPTYKNGQNMDMQHIFRKHVKPKKQHEINNFGQVISTLASSAHSSSVVDVGAGLGHLSRILTFQHGLHLTTIEASDGHAPKASELDRDLRKNINKAKRKKLKQPCDMNTLPVAENAKNSTEQTNLQASSDPLEDEGDIRLKRNHKSSESGCFPSIQNFGERESHSVLSGEGDFEKLEGELPNHVICTVEPGIAATQFMDIVLNRTVEDNPEDVSNSFVLASLHACGDLTPTILRVFCECPTARGLASVSCCYMKMSAKKGLNSSDLENFPLSSHLQNVPIHTLSYEAREMACHFADAYHQRLLDNPPNLKIHSYRAALQLLVTEVDPTFRSGQARLITKKGAQVSFTEYARENLRKLNIDIDSVPQALLQHCEALTQQWHRVVAFYTLRLSLAPLVETLLLCDRALYLLDNGISSVLLPIFDPAISPRNFALLAIKN